MHLCPWNKEGWNQQASSQQANLAFRWVLEEIRVEQATLSAQEHRKDLGRWERDLQRPCGQMEGCLT